MESKIGVDMSPHKAVRDGQLAEARDVIRQIRGSGATVRFCTDGPGVFTDCNEERLVDYICRNYPAISACLWQEIAQTN